MLSTNQKLNYVHKFLVLGVLAVPLLILSDATNAEASAQTFKFQNASCSIDPPANFTVTKKDTQVGPMYDFADPSLDKPHAVNLSLSITPQNTSPDINQLVDGVLDPFRTGLSNFKEERGADVRINGNVFTNRKFSGNFPKGTPTAGFVYATVKKGCYFILIGDANGTHQTDPQVKLLKSVRTFK